MKCQARQYSDQMQCAACGLTWDMNDPDPPKCNNGKRVKSNAAAMRAREEVAELLGTTNEVQHGNGQ